jgi:outer membrane protein OmpA-like peptidoglycan-associated protein
MKKTLVSLLLISTVCAAPAFANYFSNPQMGTNLNIGSAPNPKPAYRPIIERSAYVAVPNRTAIEAAAPPAPPPPLVLAEAPPPPPPPPVVRSFIVFFDFDKSNLTADAKQVVAAAVMTAMNTGMVRVLVTGHTDTVGSQRYNQALSDRRAGAVKAEIVRLGLNSRDINSVGKSFSEPLVSTGPGVREPQNRRAVIDLGYSLTARLVPSAE